MSSTYEVCDQPVEVGVQSYRPSNTSNLSSKFEYDIEEDSEKPETRTSSRKGVSANTGQSCEDEEEDDGGCTLSRILESHGVVLLTLASGCAVR